MNITVYINRQNEDLFKAEAEKSKLLNELLSNHYAQFRGMPNPRKDGLPPVVIKPSPHENTVKILNEIHKDEPAKYKLPTDHLSPSRLDNGVCKIHGLLLDARGRCLQKGCKYA
jgi:hypothetical protein